VRFGQHIPPFEDPFYIRASYLITGITDSPRRHSLILLCLGFLRPKLNVAGYSVRSSYPSFKHFYFRKAFAVFNMDAATLFDVKGKVVLVTGGAKGIGRSISEGFVANGAKVYISSRDAKACEQACKELNALGMSLLWRIRFSS